MKQYILQRQPDGSLHLIAQSLVPDKNAKGRTIGSHVETEATSGYEAGSGIELALAIMIHYFGSDAGGQAEAQRQAKRFYEAFLIHHNLPIGARLEITSDVIDNFFRLTPA